MTEQKNRDQAIHIYNRCVDLLTSQSQPQPFQPTFSEQISGKSFDEIRKERKENLELAWTERKKEAENHAQEKGH